MDICVLFIDIQKSIMDIKNTNVSFDIHHLCMDIHKYIMENSVFDIQHFYQHKRKLLFDIQSCIFDNSVSISTIRIMDIRQSFWIFIILNVGYR